MPDAPRRLRFFSKSRNALVTFGILGDDPVVLEDLIEAINTDSFRIEEQVTPEWVEVPHEQGEVRAD